MRGNSRRAELGENEGAVADDVMESGRFNSVHQLISAKSSLASSAPDVDSLGIQYHDVTFNSC